MSVTRLLPWPAGTRVRIITEEAPECRTGTVVAALHAMGCYRVHHDEPAFTEPVEYKSPELAALLGNRSLYAGKQTFNWGPSELERI